MQRVSYGTVGAHFGVRFFPIVKASRQCVTCITAQLFPRYRARFTLVYRES
jgi:hypothetical protein